MALNGLAVVVLGKALIIIFYLHVKGLVVYDILS